MQYHHLTGFTPADEQLMPSYHGRLCSGSGDMAGSECCCDECDYFLECFPDWHPGAIWDAESQKYI